MELGDLVSEALSKVGITEDRVSKWLQRDCNCSYRREKLNQVSIWARRFIKGKASKEHLEDILEEQ